MKEFEKLIVSNLLENINKNILQEHFVNLLGDDPKKHELKHEVYKHLQKSYEKIGGISGSGFKDPDDMVKNIHMWKLARKNGKIVAGKMYKDSDGRKSVAAFTDGSDEGKKQLAEIVKHDSDRSIGEVSSSMLKFTIKHKGIDAVKKYAKTPDEASKIMKKKVDAKNIEKEYPEKYPELKDHFYSREIGGHQHTKILVGTQKKFY